MKSQIIIPTASGAQLTYELQVHEDEARAEVRIVFSTNEELFERWLFYLLRDIGAQIVTDDPARLLGALGLGPGEAGVVSRKTAGGANARATR